MFLSLIKNKFKKKTESVGDLLNVKDVKSNFLYTKDSNIMCYLKIYPINIDLLSDAEKRERMKSLTAEISTEQLPYKLLSIPREVDISNLINYQQKLLSNENDLIKKDFLKKRIQESNKLVRNGEIIEQEFYLVLWATLEEYAEQDLLKRANEWVQRFDSCHIKAEILEEQDIILLCKSFTIPQFAFEEDADYIDHIPIIE